MNIPRLRLKIKAWFFRTIGNIAFHLNGGLDALWKGSKLEDVMTSAWGIAYISEEKAEGRIPLRQEIPEIREANNG